MNVPGNIKDKLKALPDKPGVYFMRDRHGKIIYVGKAVSLRDRVRSYFRSGTLRSAEPKLRGLIRSIHDLDYLVLRNDAEATLTEGRLIKEYRPRYNILFRDDKRFLLLRVNRNEPFPRFTTCRIQKDDGATYFGPYASSAAAHVAREFVEKRFGLRVCRPRVPGPIDHKHCLNDILRFCSAPCIQKISRSAYRERVESACSFLRGERPEYLREVREAMDAASRKNEYERAAAYRDTLFLLQDAIKRRIRGTKSLTLKAGDARAGIRDLQKVLGLKREPNIMEAYDISNISGTHAVGSMVCAVDGMPQRSRYRLFRIRTVEGSDDPGMMGEVIRRRFERLIKEKGKPPDLVILDGGITQLRAARRVLDEQRLENVPAIGLAKRFEEIYPMSMAYGSKSRTPLRLPSDSPALLVLQRVRDEAHRFALTYHRKLRLRRIRESLLDEVPGIGDKRKQLILSHFGSITRLRRASEEEIARVHGVGPVMARQIRKALAKPEN